MFLLFSVLPLGAQTATNEPPLLVPAYGEIPPTFWEQHGTLVIIGVLLANALAALVVWNIFRPKPTPVLPPEKIARDALARLQTQPEDGKLLSEVSQILRRYVSAAFGLPAAELTTKEFCAAILAHEKIGAELAENISGFLRECDERKFSPPPRKVGVQASACLDNFSAPPDTLKRELQPAAGRALELVALVDTQRAQSASPSDSNNHE